MKIERQELINWIHTVLKDEFVAKITKDNDELTLRFDDENVFTLSVTEKI